MSTGFRTSSGSRSAEFYGEEEEMACVYLKELVYVYGKQSLCMRDERVPVKETKLIRDYSALSVIHIC